MPRTAQKLKLFTSKPLLVLFVLTPVLLFGAAGKYFLGGQAAAATASTINFQARLMTNTGALAADGDYNVEFKLYDTLSTGGTAQGVCTGNCKWVETRVSTDKVHVANGYLSVNLGSVTGFPTTINWDQDLWITMNIGGTGTPTWDGEMSPRLKLTALPYAFRAGQLASLAGSHTGVLQFATTFGQDSVITLPDPGASTATVCYQTSTSCGFATGTSGSYIQNGTTTQPSSNFNISGTGTANALQTSTFGQTFSSAVAASGQTLSFTNSNTGAGVALQGINITPTNTATATSGTNQLNVVNFAAGGALGGTDNTNGINFASAIGYTNFIKTPTFALSSAGAITGVTSYNGVALTVAADGFTAAGGSTNSRTLTVTGADITVGNTIKPTSAGSLTVQANGSNFLNLTAGAASTWDIGNNLLSLQTTNNGQIQTGTGLWTQGGNITFNGSTARTITGPGATGLTITDAGGPLALSTTTSGTLSLNSAGALNLTGAAASTWSTGSATLALQSANFNVSAAGQVTLAGGQAPDITTAVTGGVAGALMLQPGTATGANNGATVTLQGGTAGGTGVKGLIQLNGATYFTTGSYSSGSISTITQSLVDSNSAILATATAGSLTFTVPTPTISVSGRVLYITNSGTNTFILSFSSNSLSLNPGATATLIWNAAGSVWTGAGADSSSLQNGYNNSTGSNTPEILLDSSPHKGLDIQDANTSIGANESLLSVRASATATTLGTSLFVVNASGKVGINLGGSTNVTAPTINNDLSFGQIAGATTARTIGVDTQTGTNIGGNGLSLTAGTANGTGQGGQLTLQGGGTGAGAGAVGGAVLIQGGTSSGASGASNGGAITLQGGTAGTGGVKGLIQLNGATYFTTGSYSSGSSATITQSLVDSNSAILAAATNPSLTFTVPSPTTSVSGRLLYVTNSGTNAFTLSFSSNTLTLNPGATATLIWNATGSVWTGAGADSSSLQNGYNNSTGGTTPEILLDGASHFGLDIQDANTTLGSTVPLLAVRASATATTLGNPLFVVENNAGKPLVGIGTATASRALDIEVNNSTSNAPPLLIAQSGSGDSSIELKNSGQNFFMGLDATDNKFKISSAAAAGGGQIIMGNNSTPSDNPPGTDFNDSGNANVQFVHKRTMGGTPGIVSTIYFYVRGVNAGPNNQAMVAIYAHDAANNRPSGTPIVQSSAQVLVPNSWNAFAITPTTLSAATTYWLGWTVNGANTVEPRTTPGVAGLDSKFLNTGSFSFPSGSSFAAGTGGTDNYYIYAPATPSGSFDSFATNPLFTMSDTGEFNLHGIAGSTAAFQVQNAAGTNYLGLDTLNSVLNLGIVGSTASASTVNVGTSTGATQTVNIGSSTVGSAANGSTVLIQGGNTATAVQIQALASGTINVGTTNAANTIQIGTTGATLTTGNTQTINIGNSGGAGTTNVTVGSTSSAGAGTTTVQAKGAVTITAGAASTWSTTTGNLSIQAGSGSGVLGLTGGAATGATTAGAVTLQGGAASATAGSNGGGVTLTGAVGSSTGTGGTGGTLLLTAGNAAGSGNNAGGNITMQTGAATGTGAQGTFQVQNALGASLLTVDPSNTAASLNLISNGGAETGSPPTGWAAQGSGSSVATGTGTDAASGVQSAKVTFGTTTLAGVKASFATAPTASTTVNYVVSFSAKQVSGTAVAPGNTALQVLYSPDNGTTLTATCSNYSSSASLSTTAWTKISCSFIPGSTTVTTALLIIRQADTPGVSRVIDIDNLSVVQQNSSGTTNVGDLRVGGSVSQGLTLLTLDTYAANPFTGSNASLAGSMYFDTTQSKIQCYDGSNWGACGAAPNSIITLSPEFAGAVLHGTAATAGATDNNIGNLTSDFCSDFLDINDAAHGTSICGTNETFNFYRWTSPQANAQTYDIYITYQLPSTFKNFVSGQTNMLGRTDSANSTVTYTVYKNIVGTGLSVCSASKTISTGVQTSWQTATPTTDLSGCSFAAGNSLIVKVEVTSSNNANAYVGTLNFQYSNQ